MKEMLHVLLFSPLYYQLLMISGVSPKRHSRVQKNGSIDKTWKEIDFFKLSLHPLTIFSGEKPGYCMSGMIWGLTCTVSEGPKDIKHTYSVLKGGVFS